MANSAPHPAGAPPPAAANAPAARAVGPSPVSRARARWLLLASAVGFGLSSVLVRLATRGGMSGGQVTLVRFAVGLAAVLALFRARPGTFRPVQRWLLVSRGAFGAIAALLFFLAIERIPAGEATLLNNCFPIFAVLLALVLFDEKPTFHLAVALAIATVGVGLVLGGGGGLRLGLGWGEAFGLLSALSGGAAVTSIRALRATDNAPTIFFAFTVGGILISLPYAAGSWAGLGAVAWAAAVGVGVVAFVAQLTMTEAYGALSVPEAALWQQLTPIASYLWALTLGEPIGVVTMLGVLLGVLGVVYGSVLGHRPRAPASPAARLAQGIPLEEP